MRIEINESEMQEWAENLIKKRIENKVDTLMSSWDWKNYIRKTADKVVREKLTDDALNNAMNSLERDKIVKNISEFIAGEIADNLR